MLLIQCAEQGSTNSTIVKISQAVLMNKISPSTQKNDSQAEIRNLSPITVFWFEQKVHNFLAWSPRETCAFLVDFIPDYLLWIIYQRASEALVILFKRLFQCLTALSTTQQFLITNINILGAIFKHRFHTLETLVDFSSSLLFTFTNYISNITFPTCSCLWR